MCIRVKATSCICGSRLYDHILYTFVRLGIHTCKKDIDNIERVQRRATRMIPDISSLSYEERLYKCGMLSL